MCQFAKSGDTAHVKTPSGNDGVAAGAIYVRINTRVALTFVVCAHNLI